jgi:SAM-dependent methyltransferase
VTALDFSPRAIELARTVAASLVRPMSGVEFRMGRFEELDRVYDTVLMIEVFEHIETDPRDTLSRLRRLVAPGGVAVISTPGFVNFRGISWMTLQNLFGFLMSPSDVHFIQPWDMEQWCKAEGFELTGRLGMFHDWGWGDWAARDMKRRISLALRDQRKGDERWAGIDVDLDRMDRYLEAQGTFLQDMLDHYVLPRLPQSVVPPLEVRHEFLGSPFGQEVAGYLGDASIRYSAEPPFNALGATNVYLCRRL